MQKYFLLLFSIGLFFLLSSCGGNKENKNIMQIICFGDSLTKGFGAKDYQGYPYWLQQMVDVPVVNLGVNGNTSADGLKRIDEVLKYVSKAPSVVVVEFGANDFFQQLPLNYTKKNMEQIVDKLLSAGATVVVASPEDTELNEIFQMLKSVADNKKVKFIDGILNEFWNKRELFSDQVHPNSQGYKLVADKIYKNLSEIILKK